MTNDPRTALQSVLEPGEQLLWSGAPDPEVMLATLGKSKSGPMRYVIPLVILGMFAWVLRDSFDGIQNSGFFSGGMLLPLVGIAAFAGLILFFNRRQATGHVHNLAYGITDRRVLIVRKGEVIESRTWGQMKWVELRERTGAEGYSDIIWKTRQISRGSSDSPPTPLQREQARVGFKALVDGASVYERIEQWREKHARAAAETARETVETLAEGETERVAHPRLGFSIAAPTGWDVAVRKKTFPFGKTRADLHAEKWYDPSRDADWNVIRVSQEGSSEVVAEVVKSEPVATFDDMADPKLPGFMKKFIQVVDTERQVAIGGIDGFRIDQELMGKGDSDMAVGERSDKVRTRFRQFVLHDGAYQYYITGTWLLTGTAEDEAQAAACQAIIDSFRGCSAMIA